MFVVRLKRPNENFDFKAFKSKKGALVRFRTAQREMIDGDVEECALFDAKAPDAERAVTMVNQGKAGLLASNLSDDPPTPPRRQRERPGKRSAANRRSTR